MPHKSYKEIFPLFRESKEYQAAKKAKAKATPQHALTQTVLNWPPEALPFACAIACIDIVSQHSREASAAYYEAIKALDSPGCQSLIGKAKIQAPDTNKWSSDTFKKLLEKGIKSLKKGKDILSLPWLTVTEQYKDNADYQYFIESICEFIRIGFNRQVDRDNECHKVIAEKAPFLFMAIVFRTIAEYCEVKLKNWNKYRTDDIDRIMNSNPSERQERLKKRELKQTYKRLKWALLHNTKLLKDAGQWYKCRVDPGSIEQYISDESKRIDRQAEQLTDQELEEYYRESKTNKRIDPNKPERSNIETAIAPFDEATGYPRKWRR